MQYLDWNVGDHVQCIEIYEALEGETVPVVGIVYTLRDIKAYPCGRIGVRVMEIINPIQEYEGGPNEQAWNAIGFKKLPKKRLEQFTQFLNKAPQNA